jgi:hypothetical protein
MIAYIILVLTSGVYFRQRSGSFNGDFALALGVALFFWAVVFSLIIYVVDLFAAHPLSISAQLFNFTAACTVGFVCATSWIKRRTPGAPEMWPEVVGVTLFVLLLTTYYVLYCFVPSQGWDALDHWHYQAVMFSEHSKAADASAFQYAHRHPRFLPLLTAAFSIPGAFTSLTLVPSASTSFLFFVSIALTFIGFSLAIGLPVTMSAGLAVLLVTTPIFENHMLVDGYAEMSVTAAMVVSAVCIFLGLAQRRKLLTAIGVAAAFSPLLFKNTGIFYCAVALFGPFALAIARYPRIYVFILLLLLVCAVIAAFTNDWSVVAFGQRTGFDAATGEIFFASKRLVFSFADLAQVCEATVHSLLINSSYSVLLSVAAVSIFSLLLAGAESSAVSRRYLIIAGPFVLGLTLMFLSLFTDYGFRFGQVGNDTGHSRFMLPIMSLIGLMVALTLASHYSRSNAYQKQQGARITAYTAIDDQAVLKMSSISLGEIDWDDPTQ